jgi:hypothetical protein
MQPIYRKFVNLNFDISCKNRLFQIKTVITFAYRLEKSVIYETLSTQKVTSKGKYESRKILDFTKKMRKIVFFEFLLLFLLLQIILNFYIILKILSVKINNLIMHKDYLEFSVPYYYLIIVSYF